MNNRTYVVALSAEEPTPLYMSITDYIRNLTHDIYKTQVLMIGTQLDCQSFLDDPVSIRGGSGASYVPKWLFDQLLMRNITGRFWTVEGQKYIAANLMGSDPVRRDNMVSLEECLYFLLSDCSQTTRVLSTDSDDDNYTVMFVRPDIDRAIETTLRFVLLDRDDAEVLGQAERLLDRLMTGLSNVDHSMILGKEDFRILVTVVRAVGCSELAARIETLVSELGKLDIEDPLVW